MTGKLQFTQAQFQQAHARSALEYALGRGYDLIPVGQRFELREHRSMVFKRDGWWIWNSRGLVGRALEFVHHYEGKSWPEAVLLLCGMDDKGPTVMQTQPPAVFVLPPPASDQSPLMEYLHLRRYIHPDIIREMVLQKRIYLSAVQKGTVIYRNVVFVGYDASGRPRSAQLRGIAYGSSFKGVVAASDKAVPFEIPSEEPSRLAVFEAAIDGLSHATFDVLVRRPWRQTARIALGGNPLPGTVKSYLTAHPTIREVLFCFDNDEAGRRLAEKVRMELAPLPDYSLYNDPPSGGKDWNEYLITYSHNHRHREDLQ